MSRTNPKSMEIRFDEDVKKEFPGLLVKPFTIHGVKVEGEKRGLEDFKKTITVEIKKDYPLEALKDAPVIRMYRDFFWRAGIDPTKVRPASEALIRRVLKGSPLPKINTLVDAYNLSSIKMNIALAAFDAGHIRGWLSMRFARHGEEFLGIGMDKPIVLKGIEPGITDEEK